MWQHLRVRRGVLSCSALIGMILSITGVSGLEAADSPVADALEDRDIKAAQHLIRNGADANAAQIDGMTALHWAAHHDDAAVVKLLLESKAKSDAENRYGVTPLSIACENGNAAIIDQLLEAGADPNSTLRGGETALMTAARTGRVRPVQLLLKHGARVDARERRQQTALMWAAAEGHVEVVELLIEAGADFLTPLKSGFSPLMFAVREGQKDVVRLLLKKGADVNGAMKPQKVFGNGPRVGTCPLIMAVENGHFELAAGLLELGADPNDQRSGYTPLHTLTWVRKPNRGDGRDGDPSPIGSGNLTSLQLVRVLVEHGADVNTRLKKGPGGRARLNLTGATTFLMASKTADIAYLKLLLELGANPTIPNRDQCTPLMAAAGIGTIAPGEEAGTEEEAIEVVKLLLPLGFDINQVDLNGETAMHGAAYKSLPGMVALLSEQGAKIGVWNRKNKYGWTPHLIAEGHRQGNFKPSVETLAAIHKVMKAEGMTPPPPTPREKRKGYNQ